VRFNEQLLLNAGLSKADIATLRNILKFNNTFGTMALQDADNVNIIGGAIANTSIDNAVIGAVTPRNGDFLIINADTLNLITINATFLAGTLTTPAQPNITSLGALLALVAANVTLTSGNIDNVIIGATTPANGNFAVFSATGNATFVTLSTSGTATLTALTVLNGATFTNITVVGVATFSDITRHSSQLAVTAFAGGGQAGAFQLDKDLAVIDVVATAGDSVKLLVGATGYRMTIMNHGANACDVFPQVGGNLGAGIDIAVSLAAGANVTYMNYAADNWESI